MKVLFVKTYYPIGDTNTYSMEVTAVFLTQKNKINGNVMCYSHIGQHCECSVLWVKEQAVADVFEYADLFDELVYIGYKNINLVNKL